MEATMKRSMWKLFPTMEQKSSGESHRKSSFAEAVETNQSTAVTGSHCMGIVTGEGERNATPTSVVAIAGLGKLDKSSARTSGTQRDCRLDMPGWSIGQFRSQ
jgi:hypothetical protein